MKVGDYVKLKGHHSIYIVVAKLYGKLLYDTGITTIVIREIYPKKGEIYSVPLNHLELLGNPDSKPILEALYGRHKI